MQTIIAAVIIISIGAAGGGAWYRVKRDAFDAVFLAMLTIILATVVAVGLLWVDISHPEPVTHYVDPLPPGVN